MVGFTGVTVREMESGVGLVELGELEALARAFGLALPALLAPPGQTEAERVLALLEKEGCGGLTARWCGYAAVVGLRCANPTYV